MFETTFLFHCYRILGFFSKMSWKRFMSSERQITRIHPIWKDVPFDTVVRLSFQYALPKFLAEEPNRMEVSPLLSQNQYQSPVEIQYVVYGRRRMVEMDGKFCFRTEVTKWCSTTRSPGVNLYIIELLYLEFYE